MFLVYEEIAYKRGFIDSEQLKKVAQGFVKNPLWRVFDGYCRGETLLGVMIVD